MYKMTHKITLTLLILLCALTIGSASEKYIANNKRLSSTEIAVSCNNGADPSGTKIGNTLIISCGR